MQTLAGRVALVTGATRGAGLAIAGVLGEAGTTVYVTGRCRDGKGCSWRTCALRSARAGWRRRG